jgi:glutamate/tyrosine decarboxylase-like PLP-dependent enzyme
VARLLDDRTALVVVSAPSYPHGVLDPVGEVATLASAAGVPCHVDACIGGWVLPYLDDDLEPFDLSVPGVTSLSVDLHKYGYAPKAVSVLLTAEPWLRQAHWFATSGWPGYPVVNRRWLAPGRPARWRRRGRCTRWLGDDGYRDLARRTRAATSPWPTGSHGFPACGWSDAR